MSLVILMGPSGAGKTTIEQKLGERGFSFLKSTTTRKPRNPEEDTYHFVSNEDFDKFDFVENVTYRGNRYGLTTAELNRVRDEPNKNFVVTVEVGGMRHIKEYLKDSTILTVGITAPINVLRNRLIDMGRLDVIERMEGIEAEIEGVEFASDVCYLNVDRVETRSSDIDTVHVHSIPIIVDDIIQRVAHKEASECLIKHHLSMVTSG